MRMRAQNFLPKCSRTLKYGNGGRDLIQPQMRPTKVIQGERRVGALGAEDTLVSRHRLLVNRHGLLVATQFFQHVSELEQRLGCKSVCVA